MLQILADAKPERGRQGAGVCVFSHGEQGVSPSPQFRTWPASRARRSQRLNDYRSGSRTHQLMTDLAKALEEPLLADVAAYYAAQPRNPRR